MSDMFWALKATDFLSAPAIKMARALDDVTGALKSADSGLKQTDSSLKNVGSAFRSAMTDAQGTSKAIDKVYESSMKAMEGIDGLSDALRRMHITQGAADSDELLTKLGMLKMRHASEDVAAEMSKLDAIVQANDKAAKAKQLRNAAMGFSKETGANQANIAGWRDKFETNNIARMRREYEQLTDSVEQYTRAMAVSKVESQLLSRSKPADASIVQRMVGAFGNLFGAKATGKLMGGMESIGKWDDELNKVGMSLGGVVAGGAAIAVGAILAVAAAVTAVVVGLGSLAVKASVAFAKMAVSTGMFRENTMMSLEVMLKSKSAAAAVYNEAVKLAAATPLETAQVITAYQDLLARGFDSAELKKYVTGLSDFSSAMGADKFQPALEALGKVKNAGKLTGEALESLVSAGLPLPDLIAKLGGKTKDDIMGVDSAKALAAILDVINEKFGGLSDKKSKLMEGLWSTLSSRPQELFDTAFSKEGGLSKYYESMKGVVDWVGKALDPGSDTGTRLVAIIDRIGGAFAQLFGGGLDEKGATAVFGNILSVVETALPYLEAFMKGMGPGFKAALEPLGKLLDGLGKDPKKMESLLKGFEALGTIVAWVGGTALPLFVVGILAVVAAIDTIAGVVGSILSAFEMLRSAPARALEQVRTMLAGFNLFDAGASIGKSIIDGMVSGITSGVAAVAGAASGAAAAVVAAAQGPKGVDAHSPSKKMARIGGWVTEGFAEGIRNGGRNANAAVADAVSPPSPSSVAGQWSSAASSGGSNGPTVVINGLTINAPSGEAQDIKGALIDAFEGIALQLNGAPA